MKRLKLDIGQIGDNGLRWERIGAKANLEELVLGKGGGWLGVQGTYFAKKGGRESERV